MCIRDSLYAVYGGLMAALFEETGRYSAMRFLVKPMDFPNAFMYGAGHGGVEASDSHKSSSVSGNTLVCALNLNCNAKSGNSVQDGDFEVKVTKKSDGKTTKMCIRDRCDGAQSLTPDQFDELMGFIRKEVEFFGKKMN